MPDDLKIDVAHHARGDPLRLHGRQGRRGGRLLRPRLRRPRPRPGARRGGPEPPHALPDRDQRRPADDDRHARPRRAGHRRRRASTSSSSSRTATSGGTAPSPPAAPWSCRSRRCSGATAGACSPTPSASPGRSTSPPRPENHGTKETRHVRHPLPLVQRQRRRGRELLRLACPQLADRQPSAATAR